MPVRTARFIARKNWVIAGADDLVVRVYNYNTLEKVTQFEAHADYIRCFAIHPTRPFVLSCSDDMSIKLWDWEKQWRCVTTYEGHLHYVMAVTFNPKDSNTFASASLDRTIKIWNLASQTANYTLDGHEKGVNCLDYYPGGERPYLVSGADDSTVRVWDYQTKACIRVMEGHVQNVSAVIFHPDLPLIFSGSEDGTIKVWSATTFRPESVFNFSLDRVWGLAVRKGAMEIAAGCDEGAIVFQLGKGEPAASMDSNGKLIWARHNEILTGNIKQSLEESAESGEIISEGQRVMIPHKELGHCEVYPQLLQHSPNGRFVVVCGDGEYIIYTALAWRNKTFGKGLELAWAAGANNDYVVRESPSKLVVFQNFTEAGAIRVATSCERVFGGVLIGAACVGGQLCFFDWTLCQLVRRIDVEAKVVYWSETSKKVAICASDSLYILQYNESTVQQYLSTSEFLPEDGLEEAFDFCDDINEKVTSGMWIGDCFVFVSANNRISYVVGGQIYQVAISERPLYLVGYLVKENRLVLIDKDANVLTYALSMTVIDYETAILKGDIAKAESLVDSIPSDQHNKVAHFLDSQGMKMAALGMATDAEFKFELAIQLKRLELAYELAMQSESVQKWRDLGDLALAEWKISLAEKCFLKSADLESLLLLYSASGNSAGLLSLAAVAMDSSQFNVAFSCFFITGRREECFDLLIKAQRYPEATLFARTYLPSAVERGTTLWKQHLTERRHRAAKLVADPVNNPELFIDHPNSLAAEDNLRESHRSRSVSFESSSVTAAMPPTIAVDEAIPSGLHSCPPISPYDAAFSDHFSTEVQAGTGSMRADDLDDLASVTISESREEPPARALERLSIQELEEEHQGNGSFPAMHNEQDALPSIREHGLVDDTKENLANSDKDNDKDEHLEKVDEEFRTPPEFNETVKISSKTHPKKVDEIIFDDDDGWD